jgi:anti-sigma factor RsiW
MSCASREQIESYAAGRLDPASTRQLEEHLLACQRCRLQADRIKAIRHVLAGYSPYAPEDSDWQRIDSKVLLGIDGALTRHQRDPWQLGAWLSLAAAAALLFFLPRPPEPVAPPARLQSAAVAIASGEQATSFDFAEPPRLLWDEPLIGEGVRLSAGDGALTLQTAAATGFQLPASSSMTIERLEPGKTDVTLHQGSLLAEVQRLPDGARFSARVHDLRVTVLGTAFALRRQPGTTRLAVTHGLVLLTREATGESLLVPAGLNAEVPDGTPFSAVRLSSSSEKPVSLGFAYMSPETLLEAAQPTVLRSLPQGASVFVDGSPRGETPLRLLLLPGPHAATLKAEGRQTATFSIEPGSTFPLSVELPEEPPPTELVLPANPFERPRPLPDGDSPATVARRGAMIFEARAHMSELVDCYERALKRDPTLAGRVTLRVRLHDTGAIKGVSAREPGVDASFLDCVTQSIRSWALPGTGEEEQFEIPLALSPRE